MKRINPIFVLLAATSFVFSANAQDSGATSVRWTYIEGGLSTFNPDGRSSQTGIFGGGSIDLGSVPVHLFAELGSLDKIDTIQMGAGWHGSLGPKADLFIDASYFDVDYDDGFRVRFGGRWMVIDRLELNGYVAWTDLDLTTNNSVAFNAIYDVTERLGIGGGLDYGNKFHQSRLFVRFNFGN